MKEKLRMAEMISAKFCHEMAGPLGAINSGVEFLSVEDEELKKKALELVNDSAAQAVNRLQFYRQAYGAVSESGTADISRLKELASNYFESTKIKLNWPIEEIDFSEISIPSRVGKILLNVILLCSQVLLTGGEINIITSKQDNKVLVNFEARGNVVKLNSEVENILLGKVDLEDLVVKDIHPYYTLHIIKEIDAELTWKTSDKFINFLLSYA